MAGDARAPGDRAPSPPHRDRGRARTLSPVCPPGSAPGSGEEIALDEKSLAVLEFPSVLSRLAERTAFSAGRERALALRPVTDRDQVVRRQRETAEAVWIDGASVNVPFGGAHDIRDRARNAAQGHTLAAQDLLDVAATARAALSVQRTLTRIATEVPLLAATGRGVASLGPLRDLIEQSFDDRGEVVDSASRDLASIRRDLRLAHERLQQRMQAMLNSPAIRAALQDPIITLRGNRYVLPVRSDARGTIPGVVHDSSASGATIYIEPMSVVDLGNRWRELQVQEQHEIDRILRELSDAVGEAAGDLVDAVERLAHVDLAMAKARLGRDLDACALAVTGPDQPWIVDAPSELRLVDARHPLLEGEAVPVTIIAGGEYCALLITGPNTGGKTVALKTAGLLCAMALAGLPVPAARGSRVPVYEAIFADIGDEQSIEQSLSTFSGHITAIIDILERADASSLVLLDELGAGTDPTEGAALGIAVVDRLVASNATLIATTHHSELKLYAHRTPKVMNASVEFDMETLAPTYRLSIGLPGQSNALAIAARLGMPPEIVAAAREGLPVGERDLGALLDDLRAELATAREQASQASQEREQAEQFRAGLERQLAALTADSALLRDETREQVQREVRETQRLLQRARRGVEAARLEQAAADLERARAESAKLQPEPVTEPPPAPAKTDGPLEIGPGHTVWLRGIGLSGEALSEPDSRGEFEVQLGALRTRVRIQQVERSEPAHAAGGEAPSVPPPPPPVSEEIEVRGQTVDEAIPEVERFLDQAARSGRARVLVIHGRGTGTLRRAVREMLQGHPLVTRFEVADPREGGDGVTIAYLA